MGHPAVPRTVDLWRGRLRVAPGVFFPGAALILVLVFLGVLAPHWSASVFGATKDWVVERLGWLFNVSVNAFLLFVVGLAFTRFGRLRLGDDDSRPEFSRLSWFAMLFSAGMGIGLMFFSVAEPMYHLVSPAYGAGNTASAARRALGVTFYHWGFHAWAIYVLLGLALAYFSYRKGLSLSIRSVFYPLLGRHIRGPAGDAIDVIAVLGTVFGLATSLGLGARQISAGMAHLFGTVDGVTTHVMIIVTVTVAATLSLLSGVQRGIRRLSELNIALAGLLLLVVLGIGPWRHILAKLPEDLVAYAHHGWAAVTFSPEMGDAGWQASWSVFYWAWWIAWAPFVATFVARISKGRTIREFIVGVLLVPTAVTVTWLAVFGETAMFFERARHAGIAAAVERNSAVAIYELLEHLPYPELMSGTAIIAVTLFFVTSSDSGSFVVDMLTSGGHPDPPLWQRIFWALIEGTVAIVLLLAGGLKALQNAAILTGLPFCALLVLVCPSLLIALRKEPVQ